MPRPDCHVHSMLQIPDRRRPGLTTCDDARDPDTGYSPIEPLHPPKGAPDDEVGAGRVDMTRPMVFSADEITDIGYETGTPATPDHTVETSRYNGAIHRAQLRRRRRLPLEGLRSLRGEPVESRWQHRVVGIDGQGRITLPLGGRGVVDPDTHTVGLACHGLAVVLCVDGVGREQVDARGRLVVPAWLRRLSAPSMAVLVATREPDAALVVLSPAHALDAFADAAVGGDG